MIGKTKRLDPICVEDLSKREKENRRSEILIKQPEISSRRMNLTAEDFSSSKSGDENKKQKYI